MFVGMSNADKSLLWKSAEQSAMDEFALSFFADPVNKICVSGLRDEASPECNMVSEGPHFLMVKNRMAVKHASHVLLEAFCKHANHFVHPYRLLLA